MDKTMFLHHSPTRVKKNQKRPVSKNVAIPCENKTKTMQVFEQILQFRDSSLNTGGFLETVINKLEQTDISVETKRKILAKCANIIKSEVNRMNELLNRCLIMGLEGVSTKDHTIRLCPEIIPGPGIPSGMFSNNLRHEPFKCFDPETRVCHFGPTRTQKKPTADLLHKTMHKQLAKVARTLTHLSDCDGLTDEKKQQLKDLVESYKTNLEKAGKEQPTFVCCAKTEEVKPEAPKTDAPVKNEEVRLKPTCTYKKVEIGKPLEPLFTGEQDATLGDKSHNVRQQIRDAIKRAPVSTFPEQPQPRIPTMTSEFDSTGRPKRTGFETAREFMMGGKIEPQEKHEATLGMTSTC